MTLTGTGGIGKTRLASQVAMGLSEVFIHGVCLVQLAPISDPDLVVPTIAQTVKPTLVLSKDNAAAIAQICIRLDGLPLSLELAAARSKLLSPQALLGQLNHRLVVLTGGRQDAPTRQQALRDTISWSYDLLNVEEQRCFRRLAIFVGGCSLEAGETVCGVPMYLDTCPPGRVLTAGEADRSLPALDLIASLQDKSLLQQCDRGGDEPRLLMLETIREYALEMLAASGEMEATEERHAR